METKSSIPIIQLMWCDIPICPADNRHIVRAKSRGVLAVSPPFSEIVSNWPRRPEILNIYILAQPDYQCARAWYLQEARDFFFRKKNCGLKFIWINSILPMVLFFLLDISEEYQSKLPLFLIFHIAKTINNLFTSQPMTVAAL